MIPPFDADGNLPEGVHRCGEEEFLHRFAAGSARRKWLGERLQEILSLARSTGCLERCFVWGSFVSAKQTPNDIDLLLVMSSAFQLERVPEDCRVLFDHVAGRVRFHADLFWSRSAIGEAMIRLWLDTYQTTKDLKRRGIVEIELT
jgi:Family of unknown function (DUF6932)